MVVVVVVEVVVEVVCVYHIFFLHLFTNEPLGWFYNNHMDIIKM